MTLTMPMVEARNKLTSLPESLSEEGAETAVAVTRRGRPVLAILSWDFFESLTETLEILGDEPAMQALQNSLKEVREGKAVSWEAARGELEK